MTRLLIVSPGFHGYYAGVARAFTRLGYEVETHQYDAVSSPLEQAWNKVRHEMPAKARGESRHLSERTVSRRAVRRLRESRPDVVLVIRGDVLTEEFWQEAAHGRRPVVTWMYDEIRRTAFDADMVGRYSRLATYSALDTAQLRAGGHDAQHVPLGFDDSIVRTHTSSGSGVISFVGAPSPRRAEALNALTAAGLPVKAWGRGWSDHPLDRARTWRIRSAGLPAGRDVSGPDAHAIMHNSVATLNIHGDQDGFTMRTFEAAGVGGVQLIDRDDVSEFYEPGDEVLVYRDAEELTEHARRAVRRPQDFRVLRERAAARTVAEHTLRHRAQALERLW